MKHRHCLYGSPARAPLKIFTLLVGTVVLLAGCQSAYYAAAEKVGFAKRDILAGRVTSARDSQEDAKREITDALTEFSKVVNYEGGELEARYKSLAAQLADSEQAAEAVREHIDKVEHVAEALFDEWSDELEQYSSASLRAKSAQQLRQTRARYDSMIGAMQRAESKLEPALRPLRDQVLFLKHNLNARAVAGLKGEVVNVDAQVNQLVRELDKSIAEANRFIAELGRDTG
jgi:chromosome segregation ATPase